MFNFFQAITFLWQLGMSISAYSNSDYDYPDDPVMSGHVGSIWMLWIFLLWLFFMLTAGLSVYHGYLISTNQTTWEHTRRDQITYLKPYKRGLLPFYTSIKVNLK
jgi:palmitoyltransferase